MKPPTDNKLENVPVEQPPTDNIRLREWLSRTLKIINNVFRNIYAELTDIWLAIPIDADHTSILYSSTSDVQNPVGLDTPLRIHFGPAQLTEHIDLAADGVITVLISEQYYFEMFLTGHRDGQPLTSYLLAYITINGVAPRGPWIISLDGSPDFKPMFVSFNTTLEAGDTVELWIVRDGIGANDGGAYPFIPQLGTIPPARSASVTIGRDTLEY